MDVLGEVGFEEGLEVGRSGSEDVRAGPKIRVIGVREDEANVVEVARGEGGRRKFEGQRRASFRLDQLKAGKRRGLMRKASSYQMRRDPLDSSHGSHHSVPCEANSVEPMRRRVELVVGLVCVREAFRWDCTREVVTCGAREGLVAFPRRLVDQRRLAVRAEPAAYRRSVELLSDGTKLQTLPSKHRLNRLWRCHLDRQHTVTAETGLGRQLEVDRGVVDVHLDIPSEVKGSLLLDLDEATHGGGRVEG